jgi:hypothetical protein
MQPRAVALLFVLFAALSPLATAHAQRAEASSAPSVRPPDGVVLVLVGVEDRLQSEIVASVRAQLAEWPSAVLLANGPPASGDDDAHRELAQRYGAIASVVITQPDPQTLAVRITPAAKEDGASRERRVRAAPRGELAAAEEVGAILRASTRGLRDAALQREATRGVEGGAAAAGEGEGGLGADVGRASNEVAGGDDAAPSPPDARPEVRAPEAPNDGGSAAADDAARSTEATRGPERHRALRVSLAYAGGTYASALGYAHGFRAGAAYRAGPWSAGLAYALFPDASADVGPVTVAVTRHAFDAAVGFEVAFGRFDIGGAIGPLVELTRRSTERADAPFAAADATTRATLGGMVAARAAYHLGSRERVFLGTGLDALPAAAPLSLDARGELRTLLAPYAVRARVEAGVSLEFF